MDKQNVTLAIPKDVLRQAKILAIQQNMSLSGLLTKLLQDRVMAESEYQQAMESHLKLMKNMTSRGTNGTLTWTREELHER